MSRFSHRNGFSELPSQLKLGEISPEFRTRILLAFQRLSGEYFVGMGMYGPQLNANGHQFFENLWIKELRQTSKRNFNLQIGASLIEKIVNEADFHMVFDLIEFTIELVKSSIFINSIEEDFRAERMAYRLKDGIIIALGNEQNAETFETAHEFLEENSLNGAAKHLKVSARLLAQNDFPGSVRESISSVESVARHIAPDAQSFGAALNIINKEHPNKIHPAMNEAFKKLYGYTSDEEGIRHPLINSDAAAVSETDALFMLGACSAFIPYLGSLIV